MAAVGDDFLDGRDSVLPGLNVGLIAKAMLDKKEFAAAFEDAVGFAEGFCRVGNAAQCPGTHDVVKAGVGHG